MNNDRIQGILFDQTELLDLAHYTRKDQFLRRLSATREALSSWRTRPNSVLALPKLGSDTTSNHYAISKQLTKKRYEAEINQLASRLKARLSD